jgi:hypothetical protein
MKYHSTINIDSLWDSLLIVLMLATVFSQTSLFPAWIAMGAAPLMLCRLRIISLERQLA